LRSSLIAVHVELLFWEGCPSHPRALADLRAAMTDLGLDPGAIALREVDTHEQAQGERFVGSPTIRIDGVDVQPPPGDEPFGLACRVYHRRDGRISPTPDPADLRDALRAAAAGASTTDRGATPAPAGATDLQSDHTHRR
jgi:hypothetical protein